jgi:hypothetical protein
MKFFGIGMILGLWWAPVLVNAQDFARTERGERLVCRADGKIQNILSLQVVPTDLEGQICAISSDRDGQLSFFVSNGTTSKNGFSARRNRPAV